MKRRYFHLRTSNSPSESRANSIDSRRVKTSTNSFIHILECFKEVPGQKKNENPKHQIILDSKIINIQKTFVKHGAYSFEINENGLTNDQSLCHVFVADNQKQFDEWFVKLEQIINKKTSMLPCITSSPASSSSLGSHSSPLKHEASIAKQEDISSSLNESADSNDIRMLSTGKSFNDQSVIISESNQEFINSFDLNKVMKI